MRNGGMARGKEEGTPPAEGPYTGGQAAGSIGDALGWTDVEEESRKCSFLDKFWRWSEITCIYRRVPAYCPGDLPCISRDLDLRNSVNPDSNTLKSF